MGGKQIETMENKHIYVLISGTVKVVTHCSCCEPLHCCRKKFVSNYCSCIIFRYLNRHKNKKIHFELSGV